MQFQQKASFSAEGTSVQTVGACLQGSENDYHVRVGSTVLTPLKWDVCITPGSRHRPAPPRLPILIPTPSPIAISSSATTMRSSPTGTLLQRCVALCSIRFQQPHGCTVSKASLTHEHCGFEFGTLIGIRSGKSGAD